MEDNDGQMAEINLKTLFVTCKSQWHGDLSKHKEAELTLKATQNALQGLVQQVSSRCKENEKQMKILQKQLEEVAIHLSKPPDEQRTLIETGLLRKKYDQLLAKSKINAKKTTDQLATFGSVRNAVVSMEIKTSDGQTLAAPLFDSALLNFPSEGKNGHETNLLTSLSFLILSGTQEGQCNIPVAVIQKLPKKKKKPETTLKKGNDINNTAKKTTESSAAREAKGKTTGEKEAGFQKLTEQAIKNSKEAQTKIPGQKKTCKTDKSASIEGSSKPTYQKKPHVNSPLKVGDFARHLDKPQVTYAPMPPQSLPQPNVYHIPPVMLPVNTYCTSPPSIIPPLVSLYNKKAFLILAVNGKQYGKIVIEIRPDVAPLMCQRFAQCCLLSYEGSYQGTPIYQSKPKTCITGGRVSGPESLYMADASPLKKTRGAVFFCLKRDYAKTLCSIVSTDFTIHLDDEKSDNSRTSTVFGFVCDGLAVCDAISHMDCEKDHIAVCSAGME